MNINKIIVEVAKKYIGQKEIPNNKGFLNKWFQQLMEIVGWKPSYAWCALFVELVWKEAYSKVNSPTIDELDLLFSAMAVGTFNNFKKSDWEVSNIPKVGSIVIWQNYNKKGKALSTGHAGIVVKIIDDNLIQTVEGNTNKKGSREGDGVLLKYRNYLKQSPTFRIKGFIYPKNK